MKRIATANRAVDLFGAGKDGFAAAVPGVSDATYFAALWANHLQESVVRVIEAAGLALSDVDFDQFLTALRSEGVFQTAAQFDNSTTAATTAFVQRALGNCQKVVGVAANKILAQGDVGAMIEIAGGVSPSVTLPSTADISGAVVPIYNNNSTTSSIIAAAGQSINVGRQSVAAFNLPPGGNAVLYCDGATWQAFGEVQLQNSTLFASSIAANGYQKLPSGIIIQWLNDNGPSLTASGTTSFPIAFPTACFAVQLTQFSAGSLNSGPAVTAITASNFSWNRNGTNSGSQFVLAIGH